MSAHMQQLHDHVAPGHAVCLALIRVSGKRFLVVGVDSLIDDEAIREVVRVAAGNRLIIVEGGSA